MPPKTGAEWRAAFAKALTLDSASAAATDAAFAKALSMADKHLQQPGTAPAGAGAGASSSSDAGTAPAGAGAVQHIVLRDELVKMTRHGLEMMMNFINLTNSSTNSKQMMTNCILTKLISIREAVNLKNDLIKEIGDKEQMLEDLANEHITDVTGLKERSTISRRRSASRRISSRT